MTKNGSHGEPPRPPVIFAIYQTASRANGGVESISRILENLQRFRPIVVTQRDTRATARWEASGIEVHRLPIPDPPSGGSPLERMRGQVKRMVPLATTNARFGRLIRNSGARVVHCNDILALLHAAPAARVAGAKVVFNVRDLLPSESSYGTKWRASRLLANEVVVLSQEMKSQLERSLRPLPGQSLFSAAKVTTIYSIVDFSRIRPASDAERNELRARLGIAPGSFAIGYVGSVCDKKNQLEYIERIAPRLSAARPDGITYFIGDFSPENDLYARRCLDAVERSGLGGRVRFVGFTDSVHEWYRALDLVCLASRNEGLARSMIEGLASAVPVVSFDVCSAREILERHGCGEVVEQGKYDELLASIVRLAGDGSTRTAMGRKGREMAESLFEAGRIGAQYEDLYSRLWASAH